MIALPFHFIHACRGVISCVQLKRNGSDLEPPGFRPDHLTRLQRATALLAQLIEFRLLSQATGWSSA